MLSGSEAGSATSTEAPDQVELRRRAMDAAVNLYGVRSTSLVAGHVLAPGREAATISLGAYGLINGLRCLRTGPGWPIILRPVVEIDEGRAGIASSVVEDGARIPGLLPGVSSSDVLDHLTIERGDGPVERVLFSGSPSGPDEGFRVAFAASARCGTHESDLVVPAPASRSPWSAPEVGDRSHLHAARHGEGRVRPLPVRTGVPAAVRGADGVVQSQLGRLTRCGTRTAQRRHADVPPPEIRKARKTPCGSSAALKCPGLPQRSSSRPRLARLRRADVPPPEIRKARKTPCGAPAALKFPTPACAASPRRPRSGKPGSPLAGLPQRTSSRPRLARLRRADRDQESQGAPLRGSRSAQELPGSLSRIWSHSPYSTI